ncbi:MAG TPA: SRPBCC family protein [Candidatus Angelobacter sp.]|nr:SRPBCC family protein [Candidatus Angelobacter sp.]
MEREGFWSGFASGVIVGALAGAGGVLVFKRLSGNMERHIVRLQKSINIACPVQAAFAAWSSLDRLPQMIDFIQKIELDGSNSRWTVNIDGKQFAWEARITQLLPNQAIGWKSVDGPHHTGRISFAPIGDQTTVHVTMNYEPPLGELGSLLPIERHLEDWIERGLRDFKASMEARWKQKTGTESSGFSI